MIGKLNHVAIAVPDLAAAAALYRDTLGAKVSAPVDMPVHGVTTVFRARQRQDRAPASLWRQLADRRLLGAQSGRRHPPRLL